MRRDVLLAPPSLIRQLPRSPPTALKKHETVSHDPGTCIGHPARAEPELHATTNDCARACACERIFEEANTCRVRLFYFGPEPFFFQYGC
jgi:hypothetical protein